MRHPRYVEMLLAHALFTTTSPPMVCLPCPWPDWHSSFGWKKGNCAETGGPSCGELALGPALGFPLCSYTFGAPELCRKASLVERPEDGNRQAGFTQRACAILVTLMKKMVGARRGVEIGVPRREDRVKRRDR